MALHIICIALGKFYNVNLNFRIIIIARHGLQIYYFTIDENISEELSIAYY